MMTLRAHDILQAFAHAAILLRADGAVDCFSPAAGRLFSFLKEDQPLSFALRDPELLDTVALTLADGVARRLDILERLPVERFFAVDVARAGDSGALIVFEDRSAGHQLERMRVDFIANASHELRTPLASLMGFVETLKGPARNDVKARDHFLGIMEVQSKRMARLIDDLLSLSRIELNAHVRPRESVDIIGVIRQIADALSPLARERGIAITLAFEAQSLMVTGERDELLRVFENLIENAIKYGGSGGKIEAGATLSGANKMRAWVRDQGPGIAPEHLPRLTERFYRVDVAASRDAGGTGLGLAIVKHIVARHRGRLEIESVPGEGSCFSVMLERC
jgi:two-component system, OmpR family, phosphate regulon sensor histidine kinase PhoR